MTPEQWLIATGVTWYLSFVATKTHGPFGIFEQLREFKGGRWHGRSRIPKSVTATPDDVIWEWDIQKDGLLDCIICLSFWVALATIWLLTRRLMPLESLAVAGVALWIHAYSNWVHISK